MRGALFFQRVNNVKHKERLRNSSRLKTKETWELKTICDQRLDLILKGKDGVKDVITLLFMVICQLSNWHNT